LILDDRGFTSFASWAERVKQLVSAYGAAPEPVGEEQWQSFGAGLSLLPALGGQLLPNPYSYKDWRQWAADLNRASNLPIG